MSSRVERILPERGRLLLLCAGWPGARHHAAPFYGSYFGQTRGNPALKPINAKVWDVGLVFAPTSRLSLTADLLHWNIDDEVSQQDSDKLLRDDYECRSGIQDPELGPCVDTLALVERDSGGLLVSVHHSEDQRGQREADRGDRGCGLHPGDRALRFARHAGVVEQHAGPQVSGGRRSADAQPAHQPVLEHRVPQHRQCFADVEHCQSKHHAVHEQARQGAQLVCDRRSGWLPARGRREAQGLDALQLQLRLRA